MSSEGKLLALGPKEAHEVDVALLARLGEDRLRKEAQVNRLGQGGKPREGQAIIDIEKTRFHVHVYLDR